MNRPRIVIKYCGNCNPTIRVIEVVKEILDSFPGAIILPPESSDYDFTLLVSGCRRDCASRTEPGHRTVVIAGCSVDNEEYEISELAAMVIKKIKQISY